jgi:uncharacterized protein (UPF0248 family)
VGRKSIVIGLALTALIYFIIVRPLLISDEARIKRGVKDGVRAIEGKDLEKCMSSVSLHYKDEYGLTYLGVKRLLNRIFHEFEAFEIDLENLRIALHEKGTAFATFDLKVRVIYRGQQAYLLGSGDGANRVKMSFAREGGRWRVTQVEGVETHGIGHELPKVVGRCLNNTVRSAARACQWGA